MFNKNHWYGKSVWKYIEEIAEDANLSAIKITGIYQHLFSVEGISSDQPMDYRKKQIIDKVIERKANIVLPTKTQTALFIEPVTKTKIEDHIKMSRVDL